MKMVLIILIIILPMIIVSSGLDLHDDTYHQIVNQVIEKIESSTNCDVPNKDDFNFYFRLGHFMPDIIENGWAIRVVDLLEDYNFWYLNCLEHNYIEKAEMLKNRMLHEMEQSDLLKNNVHSNNIFWIKELYNLEYMGTDKNEYFKNFAVILGCLSHNLEDLYVDLFWQSWMCETYGYGALTTSLYDDFVPLKIMETYMDIRAGGHFYLSLGFGKPDEYGLFNHFFNQNLLDRMPELAKDFNDNKSYICQRDKNNIIVQCLGEIIDILSSDISIDNNIAIVNELIPSKIPDMFFRDGKLSDDDKFNKNSNLNKSTWSGQIAKSKSESLKKSLITQLFNEDYYDFCYNKSKYISVPELMIYDIFYYRNDIKGFSDTIESYDYSSSQYIYNENLHEGLSAKISIFSPIYTSDIWKNGDGGRKSRKIVGNMV